jgi:hypothetical protein
VVVLLLELLVALAEQAEAEQVDKGLQIQMLLELLEPLTQAAVVVEVGRDQWELAVLEVQVLLFFVTLILILQPSQVA